MPEPIELTERADAPDTTNEETPPRTIPMLAMRESKAVGPSQLRIDYDTELAAVRKFHESQVEALTETWHHVLLYRDGVRKYRIKVAPFHNDPEKRAKFSSALCMALATAADEIIWVASVDMKVFDERGLLGNATINDVVTPNADGTFAVDESKIARDAITKSEALVVLGASKDYWRFTLMPFTNREGLAAWDHDDEHVFESATANSAEAASGEAWIIDLIQAILKEDHSEDPEAEQALLHVMSRTGFEIKPYV